MNAAHAALRKDLAKVGRMNGLATVLADVVADAQSTFRAHDALVETEEVREADTKSHASVRKRDPIVPR